MPFPTTGILDNFNRVDQSPPSANWTIIFQGGNALQLVANQVTGAGAQGSGYWNPATFGADSECFLDLVTKVDGQLAGLFVRLLDPNTGLEDGYSVEFAPVAGAGNDTVKFFRADNGVYTQLGAAITQEIANGDSIGVDVIGSTITAYRKPSGGSWGSLGNRTDTTYSTSGRIGIYINGETSAWDNFGGGTVVAAVAKASQALIGSPAGWWPA